MNPVEMVPVGNTKLFVTRLGLGGAPLGNLYQQISDEQAQSTIRQALTRGIRYVDTAPLYGVGLSESRIGKAISEFPRNELTISTKVGRLLRPQTEKRFEWDGAPPLEPFFDFSRKGILESHRQSRERLGLNKVDILLIHDPDDHMDQAIDESYPALEELRSQGEVTAIGVGMNDWKKELLLAKKCDFDCMLLAGRYTLLEQEALNEFLPYCQEKGIGVIVGAPFNSGILASNLDSGKIVKYNYRVASPEILEKARKIKKICDLYGVPIKAASLQFVLSHPAVISVIPGSQSPEELVENFKLTRFEIPDQLWGNLKAQKLIDRNSPTPHTE